MVNGVVGAGPKWSKIGDISPMERDKHSVFLVGTHLPSLSWAVHSERRIKNIFSDDCTHSQLGTTAVVDWNFIFVPYVFFNCGNSFKILIII